MILVYASIALAGIGINAAAIWMVHILKEITKHD